MAPFGGVVQNDYARTLIAVHEKEVEHGAIDIHRIVNRIDARLAGGVCPRRPAARLRSRDLSFRDRRNRRTRGEEDREDAPQQGKIPVSTS